MRVGAGTSLGALVEAVLPLGWFPAVIPGTRHVSVGGAIASDVHGKNSHRDGSFCDHVAELTLALPSGETIALRPGDERFWATAGGMGLTGVVLHADLRLRRVASATMRVDTERTGDLERTMERLLRADEQARYTVAWIDLLARGSRLGRGIVGAGEHADAGEAAGGGRAAGGWTPRALRLPTRRGALTPAAVRLFNAAYHRSAPARPTRRLQSVGAFFHPLDALRDWNRLYGRSGLVQYQMVVPTAAEADLEGMLRRLVADGVPPYLTVLKRLGSGRGGLSFPIDGWTVAMDIPAGAPGLAAALDRLDESVVAAGGRVYLAKDGRLRRDLLPEMYADLPRWRERRDAMDPEGTMRSDLARRLRLSATVAGGA